MIRRSRRPAAGFALVVAVTAGVCACSGSASDGGSASVAAPSRSDTPSAAVSSSAAPSSVATPSTTSSTPSCVDGLLNRLSREQRVGQLVMVGAGAGVEPSAVGGQLREQHVGGVVLLGTWVGAANVQTAAEKWQQAAQDGSGGVGVLVAADQEGGQVQHLRGDGFTSTPSALTQGPSPETVAATAATVGAELKAAGVNVALAPVADTVAASFAGRNAPIGALRREYGNDPATVASAVVSAVRGLQGAQVSATLKHFPGLGRVTGNTDLTAAGTTDATTTSDDAYLEPFRAGIQAGADLVMVSSALYPKIDAENRAVFSRAVITGVLRNRLSYGGVVISDDVGAAKAVAAVPVGERATRFVGAGGDVVLTGLPSTVPVMAAALTERAAGDAAFAAQVDAAARRVLDLKIRRGLAHC